MASKICLYCSKRFNKSKTVSFKEWVNTRFCTRICWDTYKRKPLSDFTRVCFQCGQSFKVKKPSVRGKFCSHGCVVQFQRNKKRLDIAGSKHPNWQGGKTKEQETIRKSIEYRQWREAVFKKDNYTCIWCGDNRGGNLNADHIKPFALYPELRFKVSNGRTLCIDCHRKTPTYLTGSIRDTNTGRFRSLLYET